MKTYLTSIILLALAGSASSSSLSLDFQPTGGTTAAGFEPFEADNQADPATVSHTYSAFGGTDNIMVTLTTANLPDGASDFRAVARNCAGTDLVNDWIGVDTRNSGTDVTQTLAFVGLPAGDYIWTSFHHDGGSGTTNGNLNGLNDYIFLDAGGSSGLVENGITISEGNAGDPISIYSRNFTSDGSDITFSQIMDNGQGGTSNPLFAFTNGVQISQVPEPSTTILGFLAATGLCLRRRR